LANKHFGNIGDIWKHLPLAEILHIEKPNRYWESHAGSAQYELTKSIERDFGVFYFLANAERSEILKSSRFNQILGLFNDSKIAKHYYPGSPSIAMKTLNSFTNYIFCDITEGSLKSISRAAIESGITRENLNCVLGDGLATLQVKAKMLDPKQLLQTFVLIDPYSPFEETNPNLNSLDLFWELTGKGFQTMLWYSFSSVSYYQALWYGIKASIKIKSIKLCAQNLWCGEISLKDAWATGKPSADLGLMGCGILCGNLSRQSLKTCENLGRELAEIYKDAKLPGGYDGALLFKKFEI